MSLIGLHGRLSKVDEMAVCLQLQEHAVNITRVPAIPEGREKLWQLLQLYVAAKAQSNVMSHH